MNVPNELDADRHFMRRLVLTIVLLGLFAGCSKAGKGPLAFKTPAGWKAEYQPNGGLDLYALTATNRHFCLLMFSRWPIPGGPEDIRPLVQRIAEGFQKNAQQFTNMTLASQTYRIQKFTGRKCQGDYVMFQFKAENGVEIQAMFAMNVDGSVWNGQFTGQSSNEWVQALTILKGVKKNG